MDELPSTRGYPSRAGEPQTLNGHWPWFLTLGIALTILGTFAIGWACVATVTVTVTWLFGFLMIAGGIGEIVSSLSAGRWSGMLIHLITGVLYTLVGFMVIDQPLNSAIQMTLIVAIFLIVSGIVRIVFALSERFTGWNWVLLNGAITFLLGLLIYKQWHAAGLWIVGLFVGLDLIFNGFAWIMLSLGLRKTPAKE